MQIVDRRLEYVPPSSHRGLRLFIMCRTCEICFITKDVKTGSSETPHSVLIDQCSLPYLYCSELECDSASEPVLAHTSLNFTDTDRNMYR